MGITDAPMASAAPQEKRKKKDFPVHTFWSSRFLPHHSCVDHIYSLGSDLWILKHQQWLSALQNIFFSHPRKLTISFFFKWENNFMAFKVNTGSFVEGKGGTEEPKSGVERVVCL